MLDLRHVLLGESNIETFAHKANASKFAKARGYYARDVIRCFNRFCIFWVVAQYSTDGWHIATRDRGSILVTIPEREPADTTKPA